MTVCVRMYMKVINHLNVKNNPSALSTPPELSVLKSQLNEKESHIQQLEVFCTNEIDES